MASRFLFAPSLRPTLSLPLTIGLGVTTTGLLAHSLLSRPSAFYLRCDSPGASFSSGVQDYQRNAKTPIVKDGAINPRVFRQISTGSIAGLVGGLAVSMFSKPLALLIGLLVIGVQTLESRFGIHVVPYGRLQRMFKNTNVTNTLRDNVALKLSFGLTFALAAFAEF